MKHRIIHILAAVLLILVPTIGGTNAYFTDQASINGITISTGCWLPPSVPEILSPLHNSALTDEPELIWLNSKSDCNGTGIYYQVKISGDTGNSSYNFESGWQVDVEFLPNNLADGDYVWQVRAKDDEGNISEFSNEYRFTIDRIPDIGPGDVLINEIMWMGSTANAADEWLELKNTTDHDFDLSGCVFDGALAGNDTTLTIDVPTIIAAGKYFLIVQKNPGNTALKDSIQKDMSVHNLNFHNQYDKNGKVVLRCNGVIIDETPAPTGTKWPAGVNGSRENRSMERSGDSGSDWQSATDNDTDLWVESGNYGTPGTENSPPDEELDLNLSLSVAADKETAGFTIEGKDLPKFQTAEYVMTYVDDGLDQPVTGNLKIEGQTEIEVDDIQLATCSDGICRFVEKLDRVNLELILKNDFIERKITKEKDFK